MHILYSTSYVLSIRNKKRQHSPMNLKSFPIIYVDSHFHCGIYTHMLVCEILPAIIFYVKSLEKSSLLVCCF
jgi:hypothetical protein